MKSSITCMAVGAALLTGCAMGETDVSVGTNQDHLSWEEFLGMIYQEPDSGIYIVNGDETILDEKGLRVFYDGLVGNGELIVHRSGGQDAKWSSSQALNLTYCVSTSFGGNYTAAVNAMNGASADWEGTGAPINFVHSSSQDGNCTASNNNVVFDVRPVNSGGQYLARAFFPNQSRSTRNVLIDNSAFGNINPWTLRGILRHELGHALGFRHEHTRPEAGTCFEDNQWRALTTYDSSSVMHYPQCNGTQNGDLVLTSRDTQGINALYGGGGGGPVCGNGTCEAGEDQNNCSADCGSPPSGGCPSGYSSVAGSLSGAGDKDFYTYTTFTGSHKFVLQGPNGTDFDLYLYRNSSLRAQSIGPTSDESINYNGSANKIEVRSYSGSGSYTLCYDL